MKRFLIIPLILISCVAYVSGQQRIDGTFAFQTDPAKAYSIYIPSSYNSATPNHLMVGLHPFNPARWNSTSWCDTLIDFSEQNGLILVCPDGGADGQVDDDIDTAFTTALIDSTIEWYNIDEEKIFLMGFSWGGRTTYTYGLNHASRFAGFMPIGAAITGTTLFDGVMSNSKDLPFYIVHGDNDGPVNRYYPARDSLIAYEACVEGVLMSGVGHTIDFPGRNETLSQAYRWLDTVQCGPPPPSGQGSLFIEGNHLIFPNPVVRGEILTFQKSSAIREIHLYDQTGSLAMIEVDANHINTSALLPGTYVAKWISESKSGTQTLIVLE